jgi:hypothetical protein
MIPEVKLGSALVSLLDPTWGAECGKTIALWIEMPLERPAWHAPERGPEIVISPIRTIFPGLRAIR